jgi:hypothetical protein
MMGKIYSRASCVVAWLGRQADNSNRAIDLMRLWSEHLDEDWETQRLCPSKQTQELAWSDERLRLPYTNGELDPVFMLLNRSYFARTWMRQGIVLAGSATLQCGYEKLQWKDFRTAAACLRWKGWFSTATTRTDTGPALDNVYELSVLNEFKFGLANIGLTLRETQCVDPRDRLYAVLDLLWKEDQQLGIRPDYTRSVEDLCTDVACLSLRKQRHLDLLEACELSTKTLNIPTWVPDWLSRLRSGTVPKSEWSACGWISAQVAIIDHRTMRVAGVRAARIEQVVEYELDESWELDDIPRTLRSLRPSRSPLADQTMDLYEHQSYRRCIGGDAFSQNYLPPRDDIHDLAQSMNDLELIWSSEASWSELFAYENSSESTFVLTCDNYLEGRSVVRAIKGYVGLAPLGTKQGDIICVLFGCRFPVVLRPTLSTWQVVGVCNIPGLMHSEAIYRNKLPSHFRSVEHERAGNDLVDGRRVALYDPTRKRTPSKPTQLKSLPRLVSRSKTMRDCHTGWKYYPKL